MSRKHNTKHPNRGLSNYQLRLQKRGYHKTPTMEPLADLRKRQKNIGPVKNVKVVHAGWDFDEEEEAISGTHQVQKLSQRDRDNRQRRMGHLRGFRLL